MLLDPTYYGVTRAVGVWYDDRSGNGFDWDADSVPAINVGAKDAMKKLWGYLKW